MLQSDHTLEWKQQNLEPQTRTSLLPMIYQIPMKLATRDDGIAVGETSRDMQRHNIKKQRTLVNQQ